MPFLEEVEEVVSLNSWAFGKLEVHEMPLISRMDSQMIHLPSLEVNPLHVIFNINEVLVATRFNKAKYQRVPPCSVVLKPRLKEFLEICVITLALGSRPRQGGCKVASQERGMGITSHVPGSAKSVRE